MTGTDTDMVYCIYGIGDTCGEAGANKNNKCAGTDPDAKKNSRLCGFRIPVPICKKKLLCGFRPLEYRLSYNNSCMSDLAHCRGTDTGSKKNNLCYA
jgi:hypothetical protein